MRPRHDDFELKPLQRFHIRMTLLLGGVMVVILGTMGIVYYELTYTSEFEALQQRIRSTVATMARRLDGEKLAHLNEATIKTDPYMQEVIKDFVGVCKDDPDVDSIYIFAKDESPRELRVLADVAYPDEGDSIPPWATYPVTDEVRAILRGFEEITVEEEMSRDEWGLSLGGYAPIRRANGEPFALVGVDILAPNIDAIQSRVLTTTFILFGAAALALIIVAMVIGRLIRPPIRAINESARRIAEGDFEHEIRIMRKDEFGLISHHFNTIAHSLRERDFLRDTFGRYMSPDLARKVLSDRSAAQLGAGEERDVTVVFSDIEGYSTMSELIPPKQVLELLNTYLAGMNEIIDQHQGCIIEFIGDAILAVFNAPNDLADHADVGVRCAMAMRARLEELNEVWDQQPISQVWKNAGKERLKARIGVHSGRVVAGNLGSRTRMKYGLIGDVVNVAARLEALNKKISTTLLFSAETKAQLKPDLMEKVVDHGSHAVKGRAGEVPVYGL